MAVGTLEEIIDDNHAIVSTSVGSEYYVNMLSFVDKDLIEPGCTVLLNNKVTVNSYMYKYPTCRSSLCTHTMYMHPFLHCTMYMHRNGLQKGQDWDHTTCHAFVVHVILLIGLLLLYSTEMIRTS